jgi:DNA-binding transcriptional LysR family regulator
MDCLGAMEMFVRIVETGSFSAVARELGTAQPTISKRLTGLEKQLKTRLLARLARSLSHTEEGAAAPLLASRVRRAGSPVSS